MIKLSNIPEETMDVIMKVARETKNRPDNVIKAILNITTINDAMRAINEYEKYKGKE